MTKRKFTVTGMSCSACSAAVERAARSVEGVTDAAVSLLTGTMVTEYDEGVASPEAICAAVSRAGYSATLGTPRREEDDGEFKKRVRRLVISAALCLVLMYITMGHMIGLPLPPFMDPHGGGWAPAVNAAVQLALTLPVLILNGHYFTDGVKAVLNRAPNMNTLIATGAGASFIYGIFVTVRIFVAAATGGKGHGLTEQLFFESAAMIPVLISLGKTLEGRENRRTTRAVTALLELAPKTAEIERDGGIVTVSADLIEPGDVVLIRAGGGVPCDGVVISGTGSCDEAVITGESVPVEKETGSALAAGSVLTSGFVRMEATRTGEETTVARIAALVEEASSSKAPVQRLADKISGIFVPVVVLIAVVTLIVWLVAGAGLSRAVRFAVCVLVISCPCALGLATPTAVMCGVGSGARHGILIKSAEALETLGRAEVILTDKTGTLTEGKMEVTDVISASGDGGELLSAAAALEKKSEHPIGRAVVAYAEDRGVTIPDAEDYVAHGGGGVEGLIRGARYRAGNLKFVCCALTEDMEKTAEKLAGEGKSPVFVSRNGAIAGIVALRDRIKPTSREAVEEMRALGCTVMMLTGDNAVTAEAAGRELGIGKDDVIASVKPDGKDEAVSAVMSGEAAGDGRRRVTVMIGDGVNDAPSLARADVGIAVGAGTDVAIESADAVLVRNDLRDASSAVMLSRDAMRIVKQNLMWAFFYNVLCIPLAAGVLYPPFGLSLTPMIAAAAMSLSSITVVSNALRLTRWTPERARRKMKEKQ